MYIIGIPAIWLVKTQDPCHVNKGTVQQLKEPERTLRLVPQLFIHRASLVQ